MDKVKELILKTKERDGFKEKMGSLNKDIKSLEKTVFKWMQDNDKESIILENIEIALVEKKVSQAFSKEVMGETIKQELEDVPIKKCEDIAESIIKNKSFILKKRLKIIK